MTWFKRIAWFMAVNIVVLLTLSIIARLLGVDRYATNAGINYGQLMGFCIVYGFGGAFISLAISRMMAKWTMGVKLVDPEQASGEARWLLSTVYDLSTRAGLRKMPQVGIYESPEVNAFATGPTRNRSLVAVSTGLLHGMTREEAEGVLAHEVAHIANGDMVTLTLVQGVVNAFVMFFARVLAFFIAQGMRSNDEERRSSFVEVALIFVFQIVFGFLGMMVVAWFSRLREFRADAGSARLGGRAKMVAALERLRRTHELVDGSSTQAIAAFKISGRGAGFGALFSTHPPLEQRIERLMAARDFT